MALTYRACNCRSPRGAQAGTGAWAPSELGAFGRGGEASLEASGRADGSTSRPRKAFHPQGAPPREACALCPGPPDLWCSPDPFQPEAWQTWSVMNLVLEWEEHHRAPASEAGDQSTSHFGFTTSISTMFGSFQFSAPWVPSPKLGHVIYLWTGGSQSLFVVSANML